LRGSGKVYHSHIPSSSFGDISTNRALERVFTIEFLTFFQQQQKREQFIFYSFYNCACFHFLSNVDVLEVEAFLLFMDLFPHGFTIYLFCLCTKPMKTSSHKMSISSTFYARVFRTKANFSSYVWLCNFLAPKFCARKMLMKLTINFERTNFKI